MMIYRHFEIFRQFPLKHHHCSKCFPLEYFLHIFKNCLFNEKLLQIYSHWIERRREHACEKQKKFSLKITTCFGVPEEKLLNVMWVNNIIQSLEIVGDSRIFYWVKSFWSEGKGGKFYKVSRMKKIVQTGNFLCWMFNHPEGTT